MTAEAASRLRVGLFLPGSEALLGGGGAERFCADLFRCYRRWPSRSFEPVLVTDEATAAALEAAGRLDGLDGVVLLGEGKLSLLDPGGHRRAQGRLTSADLQLLHLPHPYARYVPTVWLWSRQRGVGAGRRRVSVQVVDSTLKEWFSGGRLDREQRASRRRHLIVLRSLRFAAVHTWYPEIATGLGILGLRGSPPVWLGRRCFVDTERFRPAATRDRTIVFAGRLRSCKRPLLFLEGLRRALEMDRSAFHGWRVVILGAGPLEGEVRAAITGWGLDRLVILERSANLAPVLATSRLAVSTQDHENFSSMFLLEAMASGNAVLALDVGETRLFVEDGANGFLVHGEPEQGLAGALVRFLRAPGLHTAMGRRSRERVETLFSVDAGLEEMDRFWTLAMRPAPRPAP